MARLRLMSAAAESARVVCGGVSGCAWGSGCGSGFFSALETMRVSGVRVGSALGLAVASCGVSTLSWVSTGTGGERGATSSAAADFASTGSSSVLSTSSRKRIGGEGVAISGIGPTNGAFNGVAGRSASSLRCWTRTMSSVLTSSRARSWGANVTPRTTMAWATMAMNSVNPSRSALSTLGGAVMACTQTQPRR